jgi:hypothetical protein
MYRLDGAYACREAANCLHVVNTGAIQTPIDVRNGLGNLA